MQGPLEQKTAPPLMAFCSSVVKTFPTFLIFFMMQGCFFNAKNSKSF
jgi:hypothetical protein